MKNWAEQTWTELSRDHRDRLVAVLPLAATEQHGPHLPLGTDTFIAQAYLDRVLALLPDDAPVRVLPIQPIGVSTEHRSFPGTLSLAPDIALRAWIEIGADLARSGLRRLVMVTSHGGNSAVMQAAAQELRSRHDMLAVTTGWSRLGVPSGLFSDDEIRFGIHGGAVETSIMLAAFPDLVRQQAMTEFASSAQALERDSKWLSIHRPAAYAWAAEDLNPQGAVGDARAASADKGRLLIDHGAKAFCALLAEVAAADLTALLSLPKPGRHIY